MNEKAKQDKQVKILIVDDDIEILDSMARYFEIFGCAVYKAKDTDEAKTYFTENIDCFIIDMFFPQRNSQPGPPGHALIQLIRTKYPGEIIIAVSAYFNPVVVETCYMLGTNACVMKPCGGAALMKIIESWLSQKDSGHT
jgi:CheY-like chemotaxis protein